jgi:quinol monooxygenase YgiN
MTMIIVTGHLLVEPAQRGAYLDGCTSVVTSARSAPGCLDFALSADIVDDRRVNILERWENSDALAAFRGSGPDDAQLDAILEAHVEEFVARD